MSGGLSGEASTNGFSLDGKQQWMKVLAVDYNYFDMLGLKVIKGPGLQPRLSD